MIGNRGDGFPPSDEPSRSVSSSLHRGRLFHGSLDSLDSLRTSRSSQNHPGEHWGSRGHSSKKNSSDRSAESLRNRYTVLEGEGGWGGRILNSPSGPLLPSEPSIPRRGRKAPVETTRFLFRSSVGRRRRRRRSSSANTSGTGSHMMTNSDELIWTSKSEASRENTSLDFETANDDPQYPDRNEVTMPDDQEPYPVTSDLLHASRLRSGSNTHPKSTSYLAGPPSLASAVPDPTPPDSDQDIRLPPDSDWPTSVSGGSPTRTRISVSTCGVLPSSAFWESRSRHPLLGYDFMSGCLDNASAKGTVLDWSEGRLKRLLMDKNRLLSNEKRQEGEGSKPGPGGQDPRCVHRYRFESESVDDTPSSPTSRVDSGHQRPLFCCRLCRLLLEEGEGRKCPCHFSCPLDYPPESVPRRQTSTDCREVSDMTFRPDSLALSQNCSHHQSHEYRTGTRTAAPRVTRSSSLGPVRSSRFPAMWRY